MNSILRGVVTYFVVWLIFRLAGKRSLAQITTFDAVLLLIISETTQESLLGDDNSITNSILLIMTMVGLDVVLSFVKRYFPRFELILDGIPLLLKDDEGLHQQAMAKERVSEDDILNAARKLQGLLDLSEIECAVLEQTGEITIVPKQKARR